VTEVVTGLDIVRAQILIAQGHSLHSPEVGMPAQADVPCNGFALQSRVTTEDPENKFMPDYGRLMAYRSPGGLGIRIDGGMGFAGAVITPFYDSMLAKLVVFAQDRESAIDRCIQAIDAYEIAGVSTTLDFGRFAIDHPAFRSGKFDTHFVEEHFKPEFLNRSADPTAEELAELAVALVQRTKRSAAPSAQHSDQNPARGLWRKRAKL
jgi:pyruvate carboxylase